MDADGSRDCDRSAIVQLTRMMECLTALLGMDAQTATSSRKGW
jgi:hypothetical protein